MPPSLSIISLENRIYRAPNVVLNLVSEGITDDGVRREAGSESGYPDIMVRFKNRWILAEFIPIIQGKGAQLGRHPNQNGRRPLDSKVIWTALKQSVLVNFGDTGWGAVGLSLAVKYFSPTTNLCIIRVARDHHKIAWAALTLLTAVDDVRYIPNVVHISGTIKHAQLAAISHNREVIARYRALAKISVVYQDSYDEFLETSEREIEALQD